ncbi:MAG: hypothetical protein WDW38_004416 [Sanguina aurantia]
MVLKTTICRFSGLRIYPGKGLLFIRVDCQQYLFLNKKCKSYYHNRLRPAKLAWTAQYRKAHKKDQVTEISRKKRRTANKGLNRSIVGASMELIQKKRAEKPEVRQASREAAIREVKERAKKVKADKVTASKTAGSKSVSKQSGKQGGARGAGAAKR